jgi:hypothetical protein
MLREAVIGSFWRVESRTHEPERGHNPIHVAGAIVKYPEIFHNSQRRYLASEYSSRMNIRKPIKYPARGEGENN